MRQQKSQTLELAFWVVGRNLDLGSTVYKQRSHHKAWPSLVITKWINQKTHDNPCTETDADPQILPINSMENNYTFKSYRPTIGPTG